MRPIQLVAALAGSAMAGFKHKFENIVHGCDMLVDWAPVPVENHPFYLRATLYSGTESDGYIIQVVNLTEFETGETFVWHDIPMPLPYYPDAKYQVQVLPHTMITTQNSEIPWVTFGDSGFFTILEEGTVVESTSDESTTTSEPEPSVPQPEKVDDGVNKLALGVALGVTLPSLIALTVVGWMLWKRRERILHEKNRRRRLETVIH